MMQFELSPPGKIVVGSPLGGMVERTPVLVFLRSKGNGAGAGAVRVFNLFPSSEQLVFQNPILSFSLS